MKKHKENWIAEGEDAFYKTYTRYPVVFDRGEGLYLYDSEGEKYLDFYGGIAVNALGYADEEYTAALKEQAEKLLHILLCNNLLRGAEFFLIAPSQKQRLV